MAITLPTKKSTVSLKFSDQKFGMIGVSGIGKSNFWAQEENALFIEAEKGLNFEVVYKLSCTDWSDLREIYASLKQAQRDNKFPYSIIVLDTIDRIVDFAEEEIINRSRDFYKSIASQINTIGDIPNGGGWSKTRELVMNLFAKLEDLPCAVAYVGHLSSKKIKDGVREYDKDTISLWAGMAGDILAWPDHILHVKSTLVGEKLRRTVYTRPTQSREAKSRGGVIPDGWEWNEDMKKNYQYFRGLFK